MPPNDTTRKLRPTRNIVPLPHFSCAGREVRDLVTKMSRCFARLSLFPFAFWRSVTLSQTPPEPSKKQCIESRLKFGDFGVVLPSFQPLLEDKRRDLSTCIDESPFLSLDFFCGGHSASHTQCLCRSLVG